MPETITQPELIVGHIPPQLIRGSYENVVRYFSQGVDRFRATQMGEGAEIFNELTDFLGSEAMPEYSRDRLFLRDLAAFSTPQGLLLDVKAVQDCEDVIVPTLNYVVSLENAERYAGDQYGAFTDFMHNEVFPLTGEPKGDGQEISLSRMGLLYAGSEMIRRFNNHALASLFDTQNLTLEEISGGYAGSFVDEAYGILVQTSPRHQHHMREKLGRFLSTLPPKEKRELIVQGFGAALEIYADQTV